MKSAKIELPASYVQEYRERDKGLFHQRVRLYILITSFLYFAVSFQYILRKLFFHTDTFRVWELSLWPVLALGAWLSYRMNRRAATRRASKVAAMVYTGFFLWSFTALSVVYPENQLVFVFYYAFALMLVSLLIPWELSEIAWLSVLFTAAFIVGYDYVVYGMRFRVEPLIRFNPPVDGIIFLGISAFISLFIRRKEIQRDVHNFLLLKEIENQNLRVDKELELARRVHRTLVPDSFSHEKADIWVSYIPMSYVGGDYAKFRFLDDNRLLVFISDVTGHGVAAALLVNRVHAEFERLLLQKVFRPAQLLRQLNEFISRDFEGTNMYLSAFCGLFDFESEKFVYSNFGHPPQLLYHGKRLTLSALDSQSTLLGISPREETSLKEREFTFDAGDRLLLFTDGLIETVDTSGEAYGERRLREFIQRHDGLSDGEFNERLLKDLSEFAAGSFDDDIFILNIKTKQMPMMVATR